MEEKVIELSPSCKLVKTTYGEGIYDVALEYIEYSPDSWYSDKETTVDLTEEKALEIIEFLTVSFGLTL